MDDSSTTLRDRNKKKKKANCQPITKEAGKKKNLFRVHAAVEKLTHAHAYTMDLEITQGNRITDPEQGPFSFLYKAYAFPFSSCNYK